jgi:hypothetical protein
MGAFRGYRNDHIPCRTIGVGLGGLEVQVPRISDIPAELSPEGRLFCRLYKLTAPWGRQRFDAVCDGEFMRARAFVDVRGSLKSARIATSWLWANLFRLSLVAGKTIRRESKSRAPCRREATRI